MAKFYRIVKNNPPTVDDFKSHTELGHPRPLEVSERRWEGVSMFNDVERARRMALRTPRLGAHLAEVHLPDQVEREQAGQPGHFEVYSSAIDLLSYVVDTEPVEKQQ